MIFKRLIVVFLLSALSAFAHEGHESGTARSLHGGVVKKTKNSFVEVMQDELIEIYISNHDYKNIISPALDVRAFAEVKGKKIPLTLELQNNKLLITTDLKKEKHFKLNISMKFNKKEENVVFPLEN